MRPAIKIIFAPIFKREKWTHGKDAYIHGLAQGRTIWIDPRGSAILETLVHEIAHVNNPSWTEQMVRDHTKIRMKKMGWKEKARLLKLLGSAIIENEE